VVATIKGEGGSKSAELAEALAAGKKILVCTIQTFPFALKEVRRLAAAEGKTFAVIADEAHSSQTGEAASKLKETLSAQELEELKDGGEVSTEDLLAAQMKARAADTGITYVAFTATPKAKTLELFGRLPNPELPAGEGNLPQPFHLYSMRQAIEEGFILDVLQNYTPYSLAFRSPTRARRSPSDEVERSAATRGLMSWVKLHPHNISQKVQVVVEHFRENVAAAAGGRAKAMVVLGSSRKEAVRWKLAIDKYIREQGYPPRDAGGLLRRGQRPGERPEPFTEAGKAMNPDLKGRDVKTAFEGEDFHILLVANKFQTGFDQPLLCAMYIDRRLAGVQAVQTLSRLNRAYPGKDTTYVLDFSDSSDEVLKAFSQYYGEAVLEDVTDPNLIYDLRAKLDAAGHYDDRSRWRAYMQTFLRVYAFLSQIFDYGNTEVEKRSIFFRYLVKLLEFGREREDVDLSKVVLTHHKLASKGRQQLTPAGGLTLKPTQEAGTGGVREQEKLLLDEIIRRCERPV
jgi:type I restriction enzyme R subunit